MAISTELRYADVNELYLDPLNPRLGRHASATMLTQEIILEKMSGWKIEELAVSFIESGVFWTQEAMIVIRTNLYGRQRLVVIEGNRRLAALKNLYSAIHDKHPVQSWRDLVKSVKIPKVLFEKVPYFIADSRDDIEGFLGFRHVTGIEQWRPAEKAEFITKLVDKGMSYTEVMRKIGSKTPTVRQNYISYKLLLKIEEITDIPKENFQDRFSVMFLSLRTNGAQKYLNIDIQAEPPLIRREIPKVHKNALRNFGLWLFGDDKREPLFTDSRQVDKFGSILESKEAVKYLERSDNPSFDVALRTAGGDEIEIVNLVERAADNVELALTRAHHYPRSKKLRDAVKRLSADSNQLAEIFPD